MAGLGPLLHVTGTRVAWLDPIFVSLSNCCVFELEQEVTACQIKAGYTFHALQLVLAKLPGHRAHPRSTATW